MLPIIRPDVTFAEVEADLRAVLDSGTLTGGPYLSRFEAAVAGATGAAHAVAVSSATTALYLALHAAGVGPGDEVLVSDFTFPATGNVVVQLGATPVLVDSRPDAFAVDIDLLDQLVGPAATAVLVVDPFGQPADLPAVATAAARHGLVVVEDAACALGSAVGGTPVGAWPWPTCFSFHPRKVVTTGEGGAVTVPDADAADRLRRLRSHGGRPAAVGLDFVEHGFNYRLGEVPAVLGLAQLARLDEILADRRATAARYEERLAGVDGVEVRTEPPGDRWSYQSFVVLLDDDVDRDGVIAALRHLGIETTLGTYAMHAQPAFARLGYRPGDLPHSWRAQRQSLTLPLLPRMSEADVARVVDALMAALAGNRRRHAHA